jgi:hypothetical protein
MSGFALVLFVEGPDQSPVLGTYPVSFTVDVPDKLGTEADDGTSYSDGFVTYYGGT